jgi:hypothetical protein
MVAVMVLVKMIEKITMTDCGPGVLLEKLIVV